MTERTFKRAALLAVMGAALLIGVGGAYASISGGMHDLSVGGSSNFAYVQVTQTCAFCHTPHGANRTTSYTLNPGISGLENATIGGAYLWNRKMPERTFDVYETTATMDHTVGQPGVISLLCLSCHDGVGAMNVLMNMPNEEYLEGDLTVEGFLTPYGGVNQFGDMGMDPEMFGQEVYLNIGEAECDGSAGTDCASGGTNLTNDHPIGFVYNGDFDAGLYTIDGILEEAVKNRMKYVTGGRMECSSCHDPHKTNISFEDDNNFLVVDNTGSRLCLACHNK